MSVQTNLIQLTSDLSQAKLSEVINMFDICRLCTNRSDRLIGIYSEDGLNNGLAVKINLYLPIKVSETDLLSLKCCWQCSSTLLVWHDLVLATVEADRRLRSCQYVSEKQLDGITDGAAQNPLTATTDDSLMVEDSISRQTSGHYEANGVELLISDCSFQVENGLKIEERHFTTSDFGVGSHGITMANERDPLDFTCQQGNSDMIKVENCAKNTSDNSETEERTGEQLDCPTLFTARSDVLQHFKDIDQSKERISLTDIGLKPEVKSDRTTTKNARAKTASKKGQDRRSLRGKTKRSLSKISCEEADKVKVEVDGRVFYTCKDCGKTLHSIYTYVWHMRIHTGERPYVCNLCQKYFRVSQGLIRHLKETHERIKKFACDICDRSFATKRSVEEHRRIHTNERPYICAKCGKSFKQKASLFVHNRSHSSEFPYSCSECPLKFRTKPVLLIHATKHTGEKPYSCDVCSRNFRIKYELKRHKLIHSEDKPFICKVCSQAFRQKRYLRNHLKLNHNITDPNEFLNEYLNSI